MGNISREFSENPLTFIKGSETGQLHSESSQNPLEQCPDSPNCIRYSHQFKVNSASLFEKAITALKNTGAISVRSEDQQLQIDGVYRIAFFGFLDDVSIRIEGLGDEGSILHIRSSSRTGYSDLGVNRRRVVKIIETIQQQL